MVRVLHRNEKLRQDVEALRAGGDSTHLSDELERAQAELVQLERANEELEDSVDPDLAELQRSVDRSKKDTVDLTKQYEDVREELKTYEQANLALRLEVSYYSSLLNSPLKIATPAAKRPRIKHPEPPAFGRAGQCVPAQGAFPDVRVTEINIDKGYAAIMNLSDNVVSLKGWVLKAKKAKKDFAFGKLKVLQPQQRLVIWCSPNLVNEIEDQDNLIWMREKMWQRGESAELTSEGRIVFTFSI
eukprot:c13948_g1_i1.p1 GENE.c13948_g1_i1~~c13948_g1_i1.p1  ORF type:complete len:244 (+),score=58.92 c13948_g1_i1:164-895(+)